MTDHDQFQSITSAELVAVTGGGKIGTIYKGARKLYKTVRPVIKEGAELVKDLGIIGGVGYAFKKGWDYVRGN